MSPSPTFLLTPLLALLALPTVSRALTIAYCSTLNTGSSFQAKSSIWQSNGLCEETCAADYAFAILLDNKCWCSNYIPSSSTTTDVSDCNDGCPGYPSDSCGNQSKGLYAYIEMSNNSPSGTASASETGTTKSTATSSSTSETTTAPTTTGNTLSVETVAGQVKTVTIQNPSSTSTSSASSSNSSDSGPSGGTIAGIVVGTVGGIALIAGILFWLFFARRRSRSGTPDSGYDPSVQNILLDGRRHSKGSQMSYLKGMYQETHGHSLSAGSSNAPNRTPTFTDNRMKTDTVLYPNGHRDSSVSLQDNEDYSRPVLRLTNPD